MKFLIVGLGNIGPEYENTRHNIGFRVVEKLAEKLEVSFASDRLADSAQGKYRGKQLFMLKPTTYMNLSGKAVRFHLDKHKIETKNLIVITDDLALPFGKTRLRPSGSDGGHNGLKSINELLQTQNYPRIKFGIGSNYPKGAQADYVLSPFTDEEESAIKPFIDKCVEGVLSIIMEGVERTMTKFNS